MKNLPFCKAVVLIGSPGRVSFLRVIGNAFLKGKMGQI